MGTGMGLEVGGDCMIGRAVGKEVRMEESLGDGKCVEFAA